MLTPRQTEIAALVAKGMSDKAIAHALELSVNTVEAHVRDAAQRLPIPGRPRYRIMVWFFTLQEPPAAESDAA